MDQGHHPSDVPVVASTAMRLAAIEQIVDDYNGTGQRWKQYTTFEVDTMPATLTVANGWQRAARSTVLVVAGGNGFSWVLCWHCHERTERSSKPRLVGLKVTTTLMLVTVAGARTLVVQRRRSRWFRNLDEQAACLVVFPPLAACRWMLRLSYCSRR